MLANTKKAKMTTQKSYRMKVSEIQNAASKDLSEKEDVTICNIIISIVTEYGEGDPARIGNSIQYQDDEHYILKITGLDTVHLRLLEQITMVDTTLVASVRVDYADGDASDLPGDGKSGDGFTVPAGRRAGEITLKDGKDACGRISLAVTLIKYKKRDAPKALVESTTRLPANSKRALQNIRLDCVKKGDEEVVRKVVELVLGRNAHPELLSFNCTFSDGTYCLNVLGMESVTYEFVSSILHYLTWRTSDVAFSTSGNTSLTKIWIKSKEQITSPEFYLSVRRLTRFEDNVSLKRSHSEMAPQNTIPAGGLLKKLVPSWM